MTRDEVLELIREHLADELELDPGAHHGGHALPRGPGGRLAGPLHAGAGARGLLRREDVRRAGGADPHGRPGGRLRARPRPVEALTAAQAPRPARAAAGRPRPAGGHAFVVDRAALGLLRAAGLPGRLRARARGHHAPLSAAAARRLRRRPADQDPRAGGLGALLPRGRGAARDAGAAARRRRRPTFAGPATEQLARTERVLASVIEAVIGACYLEFGYEEVADAVVEAFTPEIERALAHPADFKSALQERLARRGTVVTLRDRRRGGPAARADVRGRRDGRRRASWRAARAARRRTPSRPPPRPRWKR